MESSGKAVEQREISGTGRAMGEPFVQDHDVVAYPGTEETMMRKRKMEGSTDDDVDRW